MDNRPVVKPNKAYYWHCPECEARNEETTTSCASDLTCQSCGANYKNGSDMDEPRKCDTCSMRIGDDAGVMKCIHPEAKDMGYILTWDDSFDFRRPIDKCPLEPKTVVILAGNFDAMTAMDAVIKRSRGDEHKALMRKGRKEFHK
jgi:hypothetical protein